MSSPATKRDPNCQLQALPDGCTLPGFFDRLRHFALRTLMALERRLLRPGYVVLRADQSRTEPATPATLKAEDGQGQIEEGDWVVVRPWAEIQSTLDENKRCKGLTFMPDMESFCGKSFRVRKRVQAIFDERAWRMLKIKSTFLLDDCICEGRGMYDKEGCDRCCYYFWKEDWLRKGSQESGGNR